MKTKPYVGIGANRREVFRCASTPSEATHPQYGAVIGPFRTVRGAAFMSRSGGDNPHCQTVADAERLAKKESSLVSNDHTEPTWENQLWHARRVLADKGRDALDNPSGMIGRTCGCNVCFTCAAAQMVAEHDKNNKGNTP